MLTKSKGIVLKNHKFNDKKHIVKIFTEQKGLLTFMVNLSNGPRAKLKPAFFQPFTLLELDFNFHPHKNFLSITDVKCYYPYSSATVDFRKTAIALYCSEVLLKCLAAEDIQYDLFDFIEHFSKHLDQTDKNIQHHAIWFTLHLSKYLGFFPLIDQQSPTQFFDLINGTFQNNAPIHVHYIQGDMILVLQSYITATIENIETFQVHKVWRQNIQACLLEYFQLHNYPIQQLQSISILSKVLND
jgi:DNA repair protein RecO (recombination protein O)